VTAMERQRQASSASGYSLSAAAGSHDPSEEISLGDASVAGR